MSDPMSPPDYQPAGSAAGPCPDCGYDLTGLDLPHRCPECGFLVDPLANHEAVVAWYCSWRGSLLVSAPPNAARYLHDPRCRRVARRRLLWGVFVPWLAATLCVLALNAVVFVQQVHVWWELPSEPGRVLHAFETTHDDRALNLNLHFDGVFRYTPPPGAVEHERVLSTTVELHWPEPERFAWPYVVWPSMMLTSPGFAWLVLRFALGARGSTGQPRAAWPLVAALTAPQWAPIAFLLVGVACYVLSNFVGAIPPGIETVGSICLPAALVLPGVGSAVLLWAALGVCRPRRAALPLLARFGATLPALVLPLAFLWVLVTLGWGW